MPSKSKELNLGYIYRVSVVAALGGLLFGYDWVVIGGAKPFYEAFFSISDIPSLQGWAVSSALIGCVIGTIISGASTRKYGRKKLLITAAAIFTLSAIGTGLANTFAIFVIFRVLGGIAIGLASNISPVYIAEIAPSDIRGRFVSLNQLTIVIGILLAQIINWIIARPVPESYTAAEIVESWNGLYGWRFMFWAEAIPALMFFVMMWFVPDSPRWLFFNGKKVEAKRIFQNIGGKKYLENTLKDIKISEANAKTGSKPFGKQLKGYWSVVFIGIILAIFQQWCGINVIFLYAEEVFSSAGYSISGMMFNIVITGTVNLVFTLIAITLVDKIGRRKLLILGAAGLTIIYLIIGLLYNKSVYGWPILVLIILAIAVYAMTLAPVVWVVLSEIFPNKIRGLAMAISTFALWIGNAILAFGFPIINNHINASGSFWLFSGICLAGLIFIIKNISENKGKSLEEIERMYGKYETT